MLKNNKMFQFLTVIFMAICVLVSAVPVEVKAKDGQDAPPVSTVPTYTIICEDLPEEIFAENIYYITAGIKEEWKERNAPEFEYEIIEGQEFAVCLAEGDLTKIQVEKPGDITLRITLKNADKSYQVSPFIVKITAKEAVKPEIISFKIGEWIGTIAGEKIEIQVPYGTDVTKLVPTIETTENCEISPTTGVEQDFTKPVEYRVTHESGRSANYLVTVILEKCAHEKYEEATCTAPKTCTMCGATEGEPLGHDWKEATCTEAKTCTRCKTAEGEALGHDWKEATCTAPRTCKTCGKTEGEPLGHDWKEATCTEAKTCTRCKITEGEPLGHDWKEATCTEPKTCAKCKVTEGEPLGHDWKEATCTEPKTCAKCKVTEGKALGHDWDKWMVTKKPTTAKGGQEQRSCKRCKTVETREIPRLNIVGKAKNNIVKGIKDGGIYEINEVISIIAHGDGMDIQNPIKNDVRYLPTGWKVTSYMKWENAPYQISFKVQEKGDYKLQVYFQKQIFDGKNWVNQEEVDVKNIDFTIVEKKILPIKTGDVTPIAGLVGMLKVSLVGIGAIVMMKLKRKHR